jgi:hypothetical protein
MTRTKLYYQNRIALLEGRTKKDNGRIIAKLKRKIRLLDDNKY